MGVVVKKQQDYFLLLQNIYENWVLKWKPGFFFVGLWYSSGSFIVFLENFVKLIVVTWNRYYGIDTWKVNPSH